MTNNKRANNVAPAMTTPQSVRIVFLFTQPTVYHWMQNVQMCIHMYFNPSLDHYLACLMLCEVKISLKRNYYILLTQSKGTNQNKYDLKIHGVIGGNNNQLWQMIHTFQITRHRHSSCFVKRELRSYLHRTSEIQYYTWLSQSM